MFFEEPTQILDLIYNQSNMVYEGLRSIAMGLFL